jgi:hypothetical protein
VRLFIGNSILQKMTALIIAFIMLGQLVIDGCSKKKTVEPEDKTFPTVNITGGVDLNEIGGENLQVVSAWDESKVISDSGEFDVIVSDSAAQVLFLKDGSDSVRALAISIPVNKDSTMSPIEFDAHSTALSILLLMPGILTADKTEVSQRMEELEQLADFPQFEEQLRQRLASKSLPEALNDSLVRATIKGCVDEWIGDLPPVTSGRRRLPKSQWDIFRTVLKDSSDPARVVIELANLTPRNVNVYRRTVDPAGITLETTSLYVGWNAMPGPSALDFIKEEEVSIRRLDTVDLRCGNNIGGVEYWVNGFGWQESVYPEGVLDPDLYQHRLEVAYTTILNYLVTPYLNILGGVFIQSDVIKITAQQIAEQSALLTVLFSGTPEEAEAALKALFLEILKTAILYAEILNIGFLPWAAISMIITIYLAFAAATSIIAVLTIWYLIPDMTMRYVANPIGDECDDVTAPASVVDLAVLDKTATSITVGFTMTGDDGNNGQASTYDIRYSTEMITESNWDAAQNPTNESVPPAAGETVTYQLTGLEPETPYYIAVKVSDEVPNWSGLSNVVSATTDPATALVMKVTFLKYSYGLNSVDFSCGYWPPCYWCPSESNVYFIRAAHPVTFLNMVVTNVDDSIFHSSSNWPVAGLGFGAFTLNDASMEIKGELNDTSLSFEMRFYGSLYYSDLFDQAGPFEVVFTVDNADADEGTYSGSFHFDGTAQEGAGSCVNFDYNQIYEGGLATITWSYGSAKKSAITELKFSGD